MAEEQKTNDLPEVENIDMQEELTKLEDEINTLKQVLASKETQASELRKKLGIGFGQQIQQKFATIADSDTYGQLAKKVSNTRLEITRLPDKARNSVKRELAYTRAVLDEIKNNPRVKKTSETFAEVGDSIGKAFSGFGVSATSKLAEMKSSPSFQSFEQKTMGLFGRTSQTATPAATSPVAEPAKDEPL